MPWAAASTIKPSFMTHSVAQARPTGHANEDVGQIALAFRSFSRLRTSAWTETSNAETDSSQMMSLGSAPAFGRCRCVDAGRPNSCGNRLRCDEGPDLLEERRCRLVVAKSSRCRERASAL